MRWVHGDISGHTALALTGMYMSIRMSTEIALFHGRAVDQAFQASTTDERIELPKNQQAGVDMRY